MLDYTYKDFQEISFEDFLDLIWNNHISEKIVSTEYYQQNFDYISSLTFDLFRQFQMTENLTVRTICRMIESFFFNTFRFSAPNYDDFK